MRHQLYIAAALLQLGVTQAMALELDDVAVVREGRSYRTQLTFDVAGSVDEVTAILIDYEHPERLTPAVTDRKVIDRQGNVTRVRTEIHGCIVFFCKDLTLTQDVTIDAGVIQSDIVAEQSDFKSGYLRWVLAGDPDSGTHVVYESVVEPDFFVPPLIGRYFVRKWLRQQIFGIAERLKVEAAGQGQEATN